MLTILVENLRSYRDKCKPMSDKLSVLSATNTNLEAMVRDRSSADSVARDNVNIELQLQSLTAKYDEEKKTRQGVRTEGM